MKNISNKKFNIQIESIEVKNNNLIVKEKCQFTTSNGNKQVCMCLLSDYIPRNNLYLRDLPRNHLEKIETVKFEFSDYKVSFG